MNEEYFKWEYLPDCLLLNIFHYLNAKELVAISLTCKNWYRVSYDQMLWKYLFFNDFKINPSIGIRPDKSLWFNEYKRLTSEIPVYETEILKEHADQVLHVSFSHNGTMFATCSKDGYILVWNSSHPASVKYHFDMKYFSWQYTQFSQFNESDTLLMVSGVNYVTSGEIAVFSLQGDFQFQCRVGNKPYDMFGTWINDDYILSGGWRWISHLVSASIIWLNKAHQETHSEHIPIVKELFKFYNNNASSVRSLMIANISSYIEYEELAKKHLNSNQNHAMTDQFSSECLENKYSTSQEKMQSEQNKITPDISKGNDHNKSGKLLIFTTASKSYTPHQIGFKFVTDLDMLQISDIGPSLKERVRQRQIELESEQTDLNIYGPVFADNSDKFNQIDEIIDLHGYIIGMGLSPDHRYLYVNCRPWPKNYIIGNPLDPPPIAQEIDIHVIDLLKFQEVGRIFRSHRGYTPNNECFFLFLDVSNEYVGSGSEDSLGYIWDRHYGICLGKLPHSDVVNAVAFNPQDPEMLVTVSDDYTIKIWRSYKSVKSLNLDPSQIKNGRTYI